MYKSNEFEYRENFINQEKAANSHEIHISSYYGFQTETYESMKVILEKYGGNLYFNNKESIDNKGYNVKYIYVSDEKYLPNIKIEEGRTFYEDEMESVNYISTTKIEDDSQIGRILGYGKNTNFMIKPLHSTLNAEVLLNGNFTLIMEDESKLQDVIREFNKFVDVNVDENDTSLLTNSRFPFEIIILLEYILLAIFILYEIVSSYNAIAIKKLNGYSSIDIWREYIKGVLLFQFVVSIIVCIVSLILFFGEINENSSLFILELTKTFGYQLVISFFVISLPFLYLKNIKLIDLLKKMNMDDYVYVFNLIFKTILSLIVIILISNSVVSFQTSFVKYKGGYERWKTTKQYYIIPNVANITPEYLFSKEFIDKQGDLYKLLNPDGAILADFSSFLGTYDEYTYKNDYERAVTVNPNYLIENDIYDTNGDKVVIDESEEDYIILLNEKYKKRENEILEYFYYVKEGYSKKIDNQDIKLIWVKDNQKLFTYNIEINPEKNNMVDLDMVRVLTVENGDYIDYDIIIGYQGDPMKINIGDNTDVYDYLMPKTDAVGLSKYFERAYSVYDVVNEEIENSKTIFSYQLLGMITLSVCISMSIYQNIYLFIRNNAKNIFTKTINGHSFFSKYYKYYVQQVISWSFVLGILMLFGRIKSLEMFGENILLCTISICALEFFVSFVCFFILEKKSISNVLKGDI